jgi:hypothetical protein
MKHGGHLNEGTDGQDAYLRGKLRTLVANFFRGMTVSYNPSLLQSLPAEKEYEIETNPTLVALDGQAKDLDTEPPSKERERRRRNLYTERHKLKRTELRKAQKTQACQQLSMDAEDIQQETEVAFRPGLEAEKCHCAGAGREGKPDKYAIPNFRSPA